MHPPTKLRPTTALRLLLAAVSVAVFLLLILSHPQTLFLNPNPNPNPNSRSPAFSFTIKLLTYDRPASLRRCLRSISAARYPEGDAVDIHILVDHTPLTDLNTSQEILHLIDGFRWPHGKKLVHYRTSNAGLQAQWLEAWWPASDDEFAFVVEDDLELSSLYYIFLKALIEKYYYNRSNYNPYVYGASLQRPRFVAGKHGNKLQVDSDTRLFLYQMVGTWGQLLFPKPWKEFRLWYDDHKTKSIKPYLQGMVTTGWYKKIGERIWTPWFIQFIHARGYFNIYTNFPNERALSTSHRDAGVNYGKSAGPDSYLLNESSFDIDLFEMQPLADMKWYDFCFKQVLPDRVVKSLDELGHLLNSFDREKAVLFISLYRVEDIILRNLLCQLERLMIQNYVLFGDETKILYELARRGFPVVDADQLAANTQGYKAHVFYSKPAKEIWIKGNLVSCSLKSGYDSWVIGANMMPTGSFLELLNTGTKDCSYAKLSELMFVKRTQSTLRLWTSQLISEVAQLANSRPGDLSLDSQLVAGTLEEKGAYVEQIPEEHIYRVKAAAEDVNRNSLGGKKIIMFSHVEKSDLVKRHLESLDLWSIDDDSSCIAVVCS